MSDFVYGDKVAFGDLNGTVGKVKNQNAGFELKAWIKDDVFYMQLQQNEFTDNFDFDSADEDYYINFEVKTLKFDERHNNRNPKFYKSNKKYANAGFSSHGIHLRNDNKYDIHQVLMYNTKNQINDSLLHMNVFKHLRSLSYDFSRNLGVQINRFCVGKPKYIKIKNIYFDIRGAIRKYYDNSRSIRIMVSLPIRWYSGYSLNMGESTDIQH